MSFRSNSLISLILIAAFYSSTIRCNDNWYELGSVVKAVAAEASSRNPRDLGRLAILNEMKNHSILLGKDIDRLRLINIGTDKPRLFFKPKITKVTDAQKKNLKSIEVFNLIATTLTKYVKDNDDPKNPFYDEKFPHRLGPFWVAEIIYYIVQTFNSTPLIQFYADNPQWESFIPEKGQDKLSFDIIYSPQHKIVTVTSSSEQNLSDKSSNEKSRSDKKKLLKIVNSAHFDLASGKVTFSFSYAFDGKKKAWTKQTPF